MTEDVRFDPGVVLTVREVLHGHPWLEFSEAVLSDDGVILVSLMRDAAFSFFEHPVEHPWRHLAAWTGPTVLKLRREGDWYSVWKFFDGTDFSHWYVNFETPVVRRPDRVEVNDLQLDLVIAPNGQASWKDVQDLSPCLASGRITLDELLHVLAAAAEVTDRLDGDERWWSAWDEWQPSV